MVTGQGHKVQKHVESDRVAGVSYALCTVPSLYSYFVYFGQLQAPVGLLSVPFYPALFHCF